MKILMTSENFFPRIGGAELHVYNMIKQIRSKGHKVIFFTNEKGDNFFTEWPVIRETWNRKKIIKIIKILWKESKGADVIHAHYSYRLALLVGIIGKIRRVPVFITLHGMGILDYPKASFIHQKTHSFYRYWSLQLSTQVISTSEDLAKVAYKFIKPKKVTIISNGFDEKIFNKNVEISEALKNRYKGQKIILTVRRLVPKNGVHYLIESMPYLIEKEHNVKYLLIGDGPMKDYLKKRIKELKIEKFVDMLGRIDNNKVPEFLKLADVVVFPSTAESSSLACAEAMGVGKKVVASRVGGLIELLGKDEERGRLVKLVDWEGSDYGAPMQIEKSRYKSLAEIINKSLLDDDTRSEKAFEYAHQNLSWKVLSNKTIDLYSKFVKNK